MHVWQMQEAKARLSEVVKAANNAPQEITVHGRPAAVVLSRAAYDALTGAGESLVAFMRRSPLFACEDLDFTRDTSLSRQVDI